MSTRVAFDAAPITREREFPLRDLLAKTGTQKETIHFYLREGLLPPPRRIGPRRSLYDDNHVELVELIRRLQRDPGLPLQTIKKMITAAGFSAIRLRGRIGTLVDDAVYEAPPESATAKGLAILDEAGVLKAEEPSEEALALGGWVEQGIAAGIDPTALASVVGKVGEIVALEARAAEADALEIGRRAVIQSRIFGEVIRWARSEQLRRAGIGVLAEAPDLVAQLSGNLYRPSEEFLARYGVIEFLDQVEKQVSESVLDGSGEEAATLAIVMGDEIRLERMVRAMEANGREEQATFLATELAFIKGDLAGALRLAEQAVGAHPEDPSVWAISGLVRFAAALSGQIPRRQGIANARKALQAAEALEPPDLFRALRTDFQLGRLYALLPFDTRAHERAIGHLTSALTELRAHSGLTAFPGLVPAFSAQLLFFLGEARRLAGDRAGAEVAWREVVAIDPDSNLGQLAEASLTRES